MTDPTDTIRNWSENFENNRTRDLKEMKWIPVPNKHDGDGYTASNTSSSVCVGLASSN